VKELHGRASTEVAVPIDRALALLAAVERYPSWYPEVVREVDVLEVAGDGQPIKALTSLHVVHGPLVRDFRLEMAVTVDPPRSVQLTRIPHGAGDREQFQVTWNLTGSDATRIALAIDANLSVPRLVPLGGVGDALAQGFVRAARNALTGT
jgi:hypothetical protein